MNRIVRRATSGVSRDYDSSPESHRARTVMRMLLMQCTMQKVQGRQLVRSALGDQPQAIVVLDQGLFDARATGVGGLPEQFATWDGGRLDWRLNAGFRKGTRTSR